MSAAPLPVPSGSAEPADFVQSTQPRGGRGRALLSLVPPPVRARRAPFIALLLVLLAAGLVGLLLLNTASAQDAFRLHALQSQAAVLSEQKDALSSNTDGLSDPAQLAKRAAQLGMVDGDTPIFLAPGQPLPKGAIRLGDIVYIPGPPVLPKLMVVPSLPAVTKPAAKTPVAKTPVAKKKTPVAKTPVVKKTPVAKTPVVKKTPVAKTPVAKKPTTTSPQKSPVAQPGQTKTGGG